MLCFIFSKGRGQALALPRALALGREGGREALVSSTLVGLELNFIWLRNGLKCQVDSFKEERHNVWSSWLFDMTFDILPGGGEGLGLSVVSPGIGPPGVRHKE